MDRRFIGFSAAGLLTITALLGIYGCHYGSNNSSKYLLMLQSDDDPIVVAGGSLEIGSRYGFNPDSGGKLNKAVHVDSTRVLGAVEVLYHNPSPGSSGAPPAGPAYAAISLTGQVQIDISYVDPSGTTGNTDTVTFLTDGSGKSLIVSNTNQTYPIGASAGNASSGTAITAGTRTLKHRADWKVGQVTVTGTQTLANGSVSGPYPCDNGKCQLVLHYSK